MIQPPQSYQQQTTFITTTATPSIQQYPNGGPVVESIIDTQVSPGLQFGVTLAPQHLVNLLSTYGYSNAANAPSDIENSVIRPLNSLFSQYYEKNQSYDTYFMISFVVLMIVIIFTMGLGVAFIGIIFLFPYLKNRHVLSFNDTTKVQVREVLDRENQMKWMPHGFEWLITYTVKPSISSFVGGMTCIQEAQLRLIRVSRQVVQQQQTL